MSLSYWHKYQTLFPVAMSHEIHASNACGIIQKIENILIKYDKFHLPRKLSHSEGLDGEVVIVDATEMAMKHSPKSGKNSIVLRKNAIRLKLN